MSNNLKKNQICPASTNEKQGPYTERMKLTPFFNYEMISAEFFARNDGDTVVNLILTADDDTKYFLKEIQNHSLREGLNVVYRELTSVQPNISTWVLPIARHDDGAQFLFVKEGKNFLLFPYFQYLPFSNEKNSLNELWESLEEFHQLIKNKKFPKQDYRTYQSWLEMGSTRLKNKFGDDLPFLKSFDEFMNERFSKIQFKSGPIHWDIHEDNLGRDENGQLVLLDFDLVQEGAYAQDLIAAAAMFVDWNKPIEEKLISEIFQKISLMAIGLKIEDVKFLLARNIFGDLALKDSKETVMNQLIVLANS